MRNWNLLEMQVWHIVAIDCCTVYYAIHVGRTLETLLNILDQDRSRLHFIILWNVNWLTFNCFSLEFLLAHCFVPLASTYVGSVVMSLQRLCLAKKLYGCTIDGQWQVWSDRVIYKWSWPIKSLNLNQPLMTIDLNFDIWYMYMKTKVWDLSQLKT